MPIGYDSGLTEAQRLYLDARAHKREGKWWLVKARCPYLIGKFPFTSCGCEDNKPTVCRIYDGYDWYRSYHFWVPQGCTLADDKPAKN